MPRPLRILLVQPTWDGLAYRRKIKVDERSIHPLSLGVVAALSGDHEVRVVDEAREAAPSSAEGFDLVGISVNTFNAPRAYSLASRYRASCVPVVLGGPHVSLLPEECLDHADSVVLGDAEDTWPRLLTDLQDRQLQPRYLSHGQIGHLIPAPRRDLFRNASRHVAYCQMSRGCTNTCRFCYLRYMPQTAMRVRPVADVIEELRRLPQEIVLFVDDNVFCQPDYCREVFQAVAPLKKRWWIQAPTNLHRVEGLIPLLARSGCFSVSIGFQTACGLNNQNELMVQNRVEEYGALVRILHRHAILVDGTFIFGFDGDDPDTFRATRELIVGLGLDSYTFYFLTPYPGTDYFAQFAAEGRILHQDWSKFDWDHVVVRPKGMSVEELRSGVSSLSQQLDRGYFLPHALGRMVRQAGSRPSLALLAFLGSTGWNYYRSPILRD